MLPYPILDPKDPVPEWCLTLIVVGGGTLIDEAKTIRRLSNGRLRLIAIPSIWGSGAERSKIAVLNRDGKKCISVDEANLPDAYVYWQNLAQSVSTQRARYASGDVWAHAMEGFCSPLASPPLQMKCASLLRRMLELPFTYHPDWFEISGLACFYQGHSSVGLIHGIAHTLEGFLGAERPGSKWGHAKLSSLFLWPVMSFNCSSSPKLDSLMVKHDLEPVRILAKMRELFDVQDYSDVLPVLSEHWHEIIRDPTTRTNCVLVRALSRSYFEKLDS